MSTLSSYGDTMEGTQRTAESPWSNHELPILLHAFKSC